MVHAIIRNVQEEDKYERLGIPSGSDSFDLAHTILNASFPVATVIGLGERVLNGHGFLCPAIWHSGQLTDKAFMWFGSRRAGPKFGSKIPHS
jgi:hypothetical protein